MTVPNILSLAEKDGRGGSPLAQAHGTYLAHDRHLANIVVSIFIVRGIILAGIYQLLRITP